MALGFDLSTANFNNTAYDEYDGKVALLDVLLVKKSYSHLGPRRKNRAWKLRQLEKETDTMMIQDDNDQEQFMCELEEDVEMRTTINLYKDPNGETDMDQDGDDRPKVPLEELLDDLTLED